MKKKFILLAGVLGFCVIAANAQEFKVSKSSGTLDIRELNNVSIEGYAGSEIVFTSSNADRERDERSKGLRSVNGFGVEDNTGLGISVIDKSGTIEVRQMKKMDGPKIKIMIPKGVNVVYQHSSPHGSDVSLKNIESKVEASTVHNGVELDNVTGPVRIKTVHGKIEAVYTAVKNEIDLESVHGLVDVTLPSDVKLNLHADSNFGEILVDPVFKLEFSKTGDLVRYSNNVEGKINGGGIEATLSSQHNNVYIRKK